MSKGFQVLKDGVQVSVSQEQGVAAAVALDAVFDAEQALRDAKKTSKEVLVPILEDRFANGLDKPLLPMDKDKTVPKSRQRAILSVRDSIMVAVIQASTALQEHLEELLDDYNVGDEVTLDLVGKAITATNEFKAKKGDDVSFQDRLKSPLRQLSKIMADMGYRLRKDKKEAWTAERIAKYAEDTFGTEPELLLEAYIAQCKLREQAVSAEDIMDIIPDTEIDEAVEWMLANHTENVVTAAVTLVDGSSAAADAADAAIQAKGHPAKVPVAA